LRAAGELSATITFGRRGDGGALPPPVAAVLHYMALLNFVLGAFNMLPAFPLDGGRMLRAALWHSGGSAPQRVAAQIGVYFSTPLIAIGI
jgi:Zn-dependent protease